MKPAITIKKEKIEKPDDDDPPLDEMLEGKLHLRLFYSIPNFYN